MDEQRRGERGRMAHAFFLDLQDKITDSLAAIDGAHRFESDEWVRPGGGGGRARVLSEGDVIEKGGVNVSCVYGQLSEEFAKQIPGHGRDFFATGISLVIHPRSPHAPTVHANFRYLEKKTDSGELSAWFGGGSDLTPWILYEEDARHFHRIWKGACDRHRVAPYPELKKWCDEYFFLPHRGETRGVGGIFFDYLGIDAPGAVGGKAVDLEETFTFVKDAGGCFLDAYAPILERRGRTPFTEDERDWQLRRRGRYVEFNLLYDRGTVFGLKTHGRAESILMSLPNLVRWNYGDTPEAGTYQEELVARLKSPQAWVDGGP